MTGKRFFVGRKTCEDRFTIITDYEGEIGVKENHRGDVLVLKHSDLNAQQFVAQLVVFLNDQNQAIVDLFDGSKYWSDKATEKIKELEKENAALLKRYDGDTKYAYVHKRIREANSERAKTNQPPILSFYDQDVAEALLEVKNTIDSRIYETF